MRRPPCRTEGPRLHSRRTPGPVAAALALAAALLAPLATPSPSAAARPTSHECMMCHAQPGGEAGAPQHVDAATLAASAHAGLQCVDCHTDASEIPHPARLSPVRCERCHRAVADTLRTSVHARRTGGAQAAGCRDCHGTHDVAPAARMGPPTCAKCHPKITAAYFASVHGQAREHGDLDASRCRDCHGPTHAMLGHLDPEAPTYHANLAATCARCHADRKLMMRRKINIVEAVALYRRSVHGRSKSPGAATCNDCHETHDLLPARDPRSSINRANIAHTCSRCHPQAAHEYEESVHGTAVARGVEAAPTCTDCHGEHLIRGPEDPNSPVASSGVTSTCSRCHEAQGIRETYGLPAGRLSTYEDSYHGLAARGGSPAVANCASCHGHHLVLPSSDPRSSVSPQRLAETCGRCHPGAGKRFAIGRVHVAVASPDQPVLEWVRWIYLALIFGTIGFMLFHNGLDFAGKLRRQWQATQGPPGAPARMHPVPAREAGRRRWFLRMTAYERWQHGLLFASFFTLVYTGFALKFPETWMFAWFARLEHGYALRSIIHRVAAVVMLVAVAMHVVYLTTPRGRRLVFDLRPLLSDARDLLHNLLFLTGLRSDPPRFDRFGYIEKAEYWALVWGTGVMTLTGFMLWFENQSLRWFDKWVLDLATLVHYYEAWLAFLAIVVWHLYQNIANPDVYPMNWVWLTGRIPEEQLAHEHALEWERLTAAEREDGDDGAGAAKPGRPGASGGKEPPASG